MKKFAIIILALSAVLAGCKKENIRPSEGGTGTLSLQLKGGSYEFSDVDLSTKADTDVDVNTFKINIDRKDGGYSDEWASFSEVPSMLELPSGEYTISASSAQTEPYDGWGVPVYAGSQDFLVEINKVSNVEVVCSISNMKVTVNCTDNFLSELTDFEITVLCEGSRSLTWKKSEVEAQQCGYFPVSPLDVRVKGYRAVNNMEATYHLPIKEVKAGNNYILKLDAITTGEAGFEISIDDTLNDTEVGIEIPGIDQDPVEGGEDENPDEEPDVPSEPDTPAITMAWPANPEFSPIDIGSVDVDLKINVPAGINTFVVHVSENFKDAVSAITTGNVDYLDLINDTAVISALSGMDPTMPLGSNLKGQTSVDFSLTSLIDLIKTVGTPGDEYVFTLELTDTSGVEFTRSLTFINPAQSE